jgi:Ser-tRNA(Ala) deacylase AlaX
LVDIYLENSGLLTHRTTLTSVDKVKGRILLGVAENIIRGARGGQPGDVATVRLGNLVARVSALLEMEGKAQIIVEALPDVPINIGDQVEMIVDPDYRLELSKSHSLAHLITAALQNVVSGFKYVEAVIAPNAMTVEMYFHSDEPITSDLIHQIDILARWLSTRSASIHEERVSGIAEAEHRFRQWRNGGEPSLNGGLRVVHIKGIDACLCSGTHVASTSDIGAFSIGTPTVDSSGTNLLVIQRQAGWISWHADCALNSCKRVRLSSFDV